MKRKTLEDLGFIETSKTNYMIVMQNVQKGSKTNIFFDLEKQNYCVSKEIFTPHNDMWWIPMENSITDSYSAANGVWSMETYIEIPLELHWAIHDKLKELFK